MALIKVQIPRFITGVENQTPCSVTVYVNNQPAWYGYSGQIAVFEAECACQVSFLIKDVNFAYPLPYFEDIVISGILEPEQQYEIIKTSTAFDIVRK